jgi:hypothetical protein
MKRSWIVAAALVVSAGCSGDSGVAGPTTASHETRTPLASMTPPSPTFTSGCKNEHSLSSTARFQPGALVGDVDGDGGRDTVRIALDRGAPRGCQAFIVARSENASLVAPISAWDPTAGLTAPHLNSLAQINGAAGDEIVIDAAEGASTQFEDVFTFENGVLVPMTVQGAPFTGSFAYGGSVGHLDGVACAPDGTIVISSATPKGFSGRRYAVVRRFFRPDGSVLRFEPTRTRHRLVSPAALVRLPEFTGGPFAGCAPA